MTPKTQEERLAALERHFVNPELKDMLKEFVKRDIDLKLRSLLAHQVMTIDELSVLIMVIFKDAQDQKMPYAEAAEKLEYALDKSVIETVKAVRAQSDPSKMQVVRAVLKTQELDGISITDKPVGTEYLLDLNSKTKAEWTNLEEHHSREIEVINVVDEDGGWMPFELFELKA